VLVKKERGISPLSFTFILGCLELPEKDWIFLWNAERKENDC